jgi:hypothetical protein
LAQKNSFGLYELSIPFPEKPMEQVKAIHRRRTKRKRDLKRKVEQTVGATFAATFLSENSL